MAARHVARVHRTRAGPRWNLYNVTNRATSHLHVDEGRGLERPAQIGAAINHHKGDRGLHEQDVGAGRPSHILCNASSAVVRIAPTMMSSASASKCLTLTRFVCSSHDLSIHSTSTSFLFRGMMRKRLAAVETSLNDFTLNVRRNYHLHARVHACTQVRTQ